MDPKDRLFADIAVRLQLLTREQIADCTAQRPGKRLAEAAVELGSISSDEAALVQLQAERAHGRQQPRAAGAVRGEEGRVQRVDPRAEAAPRAEGPRPSAARGAPAPASKPEPEVAAAAKPRKRGARTWESPEGVEHGQVHVPGATQRDVQVEDTAPRAIEQPRSVRQPAFQPRAEFSAAPEPANDVDAFPLAQGDEIAHVALSERPPAVGPAPAQRATTPQSPRAAGEAQAAQWPAPTRAHAGPAVAQPAAVSGVAATIMASSVQNATGQAVGRQADARPAPEPVRAAPEPVRAAPEPVRAAPEPVRAAPEPVRAAPEPVRAAISQPPPRAAQQRPAAARAPQDSYLGKALTLAIRQRASDLHVHSGAPLLIRVDGQIRPLSNSGPITAEAAEKVIAEITTDAQWAVLGRKGEVDFACAIPGLGRFRVNVYRQQRGLDAVFRIIPLRPPTLEELGLPARLARLIDYRTGMVLCTGPAGCGKSTTLAALLNTLVQTRAEHILTVEDPVEYVFQGGRALVNQRQVGDHTNSFARALRAALREDPDVIAITELRDRETISLAISAAETGHLVLGTLHTGNAAQTIHRMVSSFPADEQAQVRVMLAESLRAVVSQRLVPTAAGRGRVPAIELLMVNTAVSNLIREDKTFQLPSVMQTGKAAGMLTLDDSLDELVAAGTITTDAARKVAVKKERFG